MGRPRRLAAVLALAGAALAAPLRDTEGYAFGDYLKEFGRSYEGPELALRRAIFAVRLEEINAHNREYLAGRRSWYAAVNHLTDRTEEEFRRVKGGMADRGTVRQPLAELARDEPNPARKDWREHKVVTPVKNQLGCGSCWAFSATETVESHVAIATGTLLELAPQTLVNCVENPHHCGGTGGCEGATMELGFNLTKQRGLALESDLPYKAHDESCAPYKAAAVVGGYVKLPVNDADALETAIATKGPVSITVAATWMLYGGGIFDGGCSDKDCPLDHGVVAVGYDRTEGYWLVRNSWGPHWGEDGYIRLTRANDGKTFVDRSPADGVACEPLPKSQTVGGESGMLFDASYPTGAALAPGTAEAAEGAATLVI